MGTSGYDVIVVGGGLAGLSCAFELVELGRRVLLVEAAPFVGGRTSSWTEPDGMKVESGLHRVLGFYEEFPRLLQRAGIALDSAVIWEDEVEFREPQLAPAVFSASWLHRPLSTLAGAFANPHYLSAAARASLTQLMAVGLKDYAARPQELDRETILEYARRHEVHPEVISRILDPLTSGIFFIPAARYSAYAFFGLVGPYLPNLWKLRIGAFSGGMSDVLAQPLADAIERRGGEVRVASPIDDLAVVNGRVVGVNIRGALLQASEVVLAVPLDVAQRLIRRHWEHDRAFQPMLKLRTMPAATLQLELRGPAAPVDRTTFGTGTALACFSEQSRTTFRHVPGRVSVILAPADEFVRMAPEQVLERALADADRIGLALRGNVVRYRVINHPADFYALEPNQDQLRPAQATSIAGLTLAGDYTRQKFLATMEGAVVSGQLAAQTVNGRLAEMRTGG